MKKLTRVEMKNLRGGDEELSGSIGFSNCSATCADGTTRKIDDCSGTCSCTDNVGCTCSGSTPLTKSCK